MILNIDALSAIGLLVKFSERLVWYFDLTNKDA